MVLTRDGAAGALGLADGPVLIEGGGALDGGLVGAHAQVDVVRAAVAGDGAFVRQPAGGVVCAQVFEDVVLDERAGRPAVHRQVAVPVGFVVGCVADRAEGGG